VTAFLFAEKGKGEALLSEFSDRVDLEGRSSPGSSCLEGKGPALGPVSLSGGKEVIYSFSIPA